MARKKLLWLARTDRRNAGALEGVKQREIVMVDRGVPQGIVGSISRKAPPVEGFDAKITRRYSSSGRGIVIVHGGRAASRA